MASGNPCAVIFQKVMKAIHEDLPNKDFFSCSGLTSVSVCADSGMLASENCALDVRGSRLQNRKFQDVIDLVNEGKVDLRGSISHTWNFEDAQAAFDFVDSRDPSYRKGVLTFKK